MTSPNRDRPEGVHRTVDAGGTLTHYWEYGDPTDAPLVLVHGFRGDHHGLEGLAQEIVATTAGLRAIVPDLPGFGESPAIPGVQHDLPLYGEWLRAFATGVVPERFVLLGHSFGTLIVSQALANGLAPERLILINPISAPALKGPKSTLTKLAIGYYKAADLLPEPASRALLSNPLIVRGMSEVMAKSRDRKLRAWIHQQHAQHFSSFSDSRTLLQAFRASVSHTVPEFAAAMTMPTLLIAGELDDITPLPRQLELQRTIPTSTLHVIQGTGHLVHYEAVDDAAQFVVEFLADQTAGAA